MLISLPASAELNRPVKAEYLGLAAALLSGVWCIASYLSVIITHVSRLFCSLSESFFMVKGAALFLQQGSSHQGQKAHPHHKHAGETHKTLTKLNSSSPDYLRLSKLLFWSHQSARQTARQLLSPGYVAGSSDELMFFSRCLWGVTKAASLISMFQTYSLGRLELKSSVW